MRVKGVFRPDDYQGESQDDLAALFAFVAPGQADPAIDIGHAGVAAAALNPKVALHMAQLSRTIALDTGWAKRADLRELAFHAINTRYACTFSATIRRPYALAAGLSEAQLDAVADWRGGELFNGEQQLVLAYAEAVMAGDVPDQLFAWALAAWGDTGTMEYTALIGFWSCWAMVINAAAPRLETA